MADQTPHYSIALLCDGANRIHLVLNDASELPVAPGDLFTDLFDRGSKEKALRFLQTIRDRQAAFGWELHVRWREQVLLLRFVGTRVPEGILVAAAATQAQANALFDRMVQGQLRPPQSEDLSVQEQVTLFEQLASLNNQLVTMQRELEKKNAELTRMLADRARIAAMAAHDLRSPLQVIMLGATSLDKKFGNPDDGTPTREIEMIRRNADQMLMLVNDLLAAYSADIGMFELAMQPLDLEALARTNAANSRDIAGVKQIALTFDSSGDIPRVLGDPMRLDQVLNNLVHNSIKFSPPGSAIRMKLSATGSEAVLAIEDQGVGMKQETLDALIKGTPGKPRRGTQSETGFGLGFMIIRSVIERHRGSLDGELLPDRGVRFSIRLPVYSGA